MTILVTGASGSLGGYLLAALPEQEQVEAWSGQATGERARRRLRPVALERLDDWLDPLERASPELIFHTAAVARPAAVDLQPELAQAVNVTASKKLADWAEASGAFLVFTSTDLVFDGEQAPYTESDPVAPRSRYGAMKAAAEEHVLGSGGAVVRLSLMYGPDAWPGEETFFDRQLRAALGLDTVRLHVDEWRTPLALADAARGLWAIGQARAAGLWHLGGPERLSRYELGLQSAEVLRGILGVDPALVRSDVGKGRTSDEPRATEPPELVAAAMDGSDRPRDVSLDSRRFRAAFPGARPRPLAPALAEMVQLRRRVQRGYPLRDGETLDAIST